FIFECTFGVHSLTEVAVGVYVEPVEYVGDIDEMPAVVARAYDETAGAIPYRLLCGVFKFLDVVRRISADAVTYILRKHAGIGGISILQLVHRAEGTIVVGLLIEYGCRRHIAEIYAASRIYELGVVYFRREPLLRFRRIEVV